MNAVPVEVLMSGDSAKTLIHALELAMRKGSYTSAECAQINFAIQQLETEISA